jgi:hypothetical protein
MKGRARCSAATALAAVAGLVMLTVTDGSAPPRGGGGLKAAAARAGGLKTAARLARLPMVFEENAGQFGRGVKFVARASGYTLWLTEGGAELALRGQEAGVRRREEKSRQRPAISRRLSGLGDAFGRAGRRRQGSRGQGRTRTDVVRLRLEGANRAAKVAGREELAGKANYLLGSDPSKWRVNVPTFGEVAYREVYRGIDLVYYGRGGRLEYDFVVHPGGDPALIRLGLAGRDAADSGVAVRIASNGDLVMRTRAGEVRFKKPEVYQARSPESEAGRRQNGGQRPRAADNEPGARDHRQSIPGHFVLHTVRNPKSPIPSYQISFALGAYDHSQPLIIDPVLSYSTYLGGSAFDDATGIAVDSSGDVYVTGYTTSTDFPVVSAVDKSYGGGTCNNDMSPAPCFDAFVAKLNPQGTGLVYSTYLGGSGDDRGAHIAVDSAGDAYVVGYTNSSDFPTASPLQGSIGGGTCGSTTNPYPCYDAFVVKLGPSGSSLIYSTYLGGQGDDYGMGIAVDSSGSAYVAGFTSGSNFPVTGGAFEASFGGGPYDAFVAKLNPQGTSLVYSTLLGGSGEDRASAVAVDSSGDAYVTGQTNSTNFPTANPFQAAYAASSCGCFDAFITKLNATGSALVYSTYLGGSGGNYGNAIALDSADEAFIAGWTTSADFPVTSEAYQKTYGGSDDAFISKLSAAGNSLVYSTYLGGIDPEVAAGIGVDGSGNAYITGNAYGVGFPAVNPLQAANAGFYDAFVAAFNPSGSGLLYATWLGGSGDDFGNDIAVDSTGDAYVAGETFSTDFPTTPGAFQTAYAGGAYDGFIAKIGPANAAGVSVTPDPVGFDDQEVGTTSTPQNVKVMDAGSDSLNVSAVSATGDFAVSNDCSAVAAGTSCKVSVTFAPTAVGARTGTLTLADNAAGSPQTISLVGTGTSGAVSLSATSLNFGSVQTGTASAAQSVTLSNTAATPLYISNLQAEGTYSQTSDCGSTVASGSSCTISVTFQPTAAGASVGQILITDSAPASPQSIELTGTGTAPQAALAPASLAFGNQAVGTASTPQAVTLSNPGNAGLSITGIAASGDFSQTNNCGSSLAASASCTIQVTFNPAAAGALAGTLTVSDNAAGSPQTVSMAGNGIIAFTLSANANTTTVIAGTDQASFQVSASSAYGFTGTINLACSGSAPANCSFSPAAITAGNTSALTVSNLAGVTAGSLSFDVVGTSGSQSAEAPLTILFAAFSLSPSSTSATIVAGGTANYNVNVTPLNGFTAPVSLSCSGAPSAASCLISPASVSLDGTNAVKVAVSVATTAASLPRPNLRLPPLVLPGSVRFDPGWALSVLVIALFLMGGWVRRQRGQGFKTKVLLPVLMAIALASCGGGGGGVAPDPPPADPPTAPGTYTLTVQGTSGSLSRQISLTLTVN